MRAHPLGLGQLVHHVDARQVLGQRRALAAPAPRVAGDRDRLVGSLAAALRSASSAASSSASLNSPSWPSATRSLEAPKRRASSKPQLLVSALRWSRRARRAQRRCSTMRAQRCALSASTSSGSSSSGSCDGAGHGANIAAPRRRAIERVPIDGRCAPDRRSAQATHCVVQALMRAPAREVEAVEQPVQLLAAQRHRRALAARPVEALALQALHPQHEAAALPVQDLHPVATPVGEHEQLLAERVQRELVLHQCREAVDLLAEVDRVDAQVDLGQVVAPGASWQRGHAREQLRPVLRAHRRPRPRCRCEDGPGSTPLRRSRRARVRRGPGAAVDAQNPLRLRRDFASYSARKSSPCASAYAFSEPLPHARRCSSQNRWRSVSRGSWGIACSSLGEENTLTHNRCLGNHAVRGADTIVRQPEARRSRIGTTRGAIPHSRTAPRSDE